MDWPEYCCFNDEICIIKEAQRLILFHGGDLWIKKKKLDMVMRAFISAEACELVSIFLLWQLRHLSDLDDMGIYHNDSLMVVHSKRLR